jgi:hypothetical protein
MKGKRYCITLIFVLVLMGGLSATTMNGFAAVSSTQSQIVVQFDLPDYKLETTQVNGRDLQYILTGDQTTTAVQGAPALPLLSCSVALPDRGDVSAEIQILSETVIPCGTIVPSMNTTLDNLVFDPAVYGTANEYPQKVFETSEPGLMRNQRVLALRVLPFVYNDARHELRVITSARIVVNNDTNRPGVNEVADPTRPLSKDFVDMYREVLINYDMMPHRDTFQQPAILYICTPNTTIENDLQVLMDWKKRLGYKVYKATTSATGTSTTSILAYIQNAYNTWPIPPTFVSLVGDTGIIPVFYRTNEGNNGEGDHPYALLSGSDEVEDVFIGRISYSSNTDLEVMIAKFCTYESTPYMTDSSWLARACVVGDYSSSGYSCNTTKRYTKQVMSYYNPAMTINEIYSGSFSTQMTSNANAGLTYFNYRGYIGMSGWSNTTGLTNYNKLCFATFITCGTGDYADDTATTESIVRAGTSSQPTGAVGAVGCSTIHTMVPFNNVVDAGIYTGLFTHNLRTLGQGLMYGKYALWQAYSGTAGLSTYFLFFVHNSSLIGEPSTQAWKGVPTALAATYPTTIALSTDSVPVTVTAGGSPVANAWVTLFQKNTSGTDIIQSTGYTDASGQIFLSATSTTSGAGYLTASKPGYLPVNGTVTFGTLAYSVSMGTPTFDDDASGSSSGNGDGYVNPGETIELRVPLTNNGTTALSSITGTLSTTTAGVTITDNVETWSNLAAGGSGTCADAFKFTVASSYPGLQEAVFNLHIMYGSSGGYFDRQIRVTPRASLLRTNTWTISAGGNGVLDPGENGSLLVNLSNLGGIASPAVTGVISTTNPLVTFSNNTVSWNSIAASGSGNSTTLYTVAAAASVVRGTQVPCTITFSGANGFSATTSFNLTVGTTVVGDPLGPDPYGYYIYDSFDTSHDACPVYSWVEISPSLGGSGTSMNLNDNGDDQDATTTYNLPFAFKLYGVTYPINTPLSVCSNGWISFGATAMQDFRNTRIPGTMGPSPMIAPFWDDLIKSSTGNVYRYYDANNHWVVIEWSQMHSYHYGSEETFQVILMDPNFYPTVTGDGQIKIQYKVVNNVDNWYDAGYSPEPGQYATVGLEDQSGTIGLEYTYNNTYPTAAHTLANQMALLITTPIIHQDPPIISASPVNFEMNVVLGQTGTTSMTISNSGVADLNYTLTKSYGDTRNSGGPDSYGYTWTDSNEAGGPAVSWTDISAVGTTLTFTVDDQLMTDIPLGFDFNYYGTVYNTCIVAANGYLCFTEPSSDIWTNTTIPSSSEPNNLIAGFWDDLSPQNSGSVTYYNDTANERFILQYLAVPHYNSTGTYSFQIILHANWDIELQYNSMLQSLNNATVGIENADGTVGLQMVYNNTYIASNKAVYIVSPYNPEPPVIDWLTIMPSAGSIESPNSTTINFEVSTAELVLGDYLCTVTLSNNDTSNPTITIPFILHVVEHFSAPMPPANLVVSVSGGVPTLTWDPVTTDIEGNTITDAIYYTVYRSTLSVEITSANVLDYAFTNSFTDTSGSGGNGFRYYVTASYGERPANRPMLTREAQRK